MNREDNNKDNIIDFWFSLFPELEDKKEFIDLVQSSLNLDICSLYNKRQQYTLNSGIADSFLHDNNIISSKLSYFNGLLQCKMQWIFFFEPIVNIYFCDLYIALYKLDCILDSEELFISILENLYENLVNKSFRVLVLETQNAQKENLLLGDDSTEKGTYFCNILLKNKEYVKKLYNTYPELVNLLEINVINTFKYVNEIINNINDLYIKGRTDYGKLKNLMIGAGDTHNNGKSVVKLAFEKQAIYYKPRSVAYEKIYSQLLDWFKSNNPNFKEIYYCKVIDIGTCGLVEEIHNEECKTLDDVKDYYYKIGELLGILYTLNSRDFHSENIVAKGNSPVLIDLETLLHANLNNINIEDITLKVINEIENSVLSTALLPTLLVNNKNLQVLEVGGIGKGLPQISPFKTQRLKHAAQDNVSIEFYYKTLPMTKNYPNYENEIVGCQDYIIDVKKGFKDIYFWILDNKTLYYDKLSQLFNNTECRIVLRNTNVYNQIIETSYHPDVLRNPWDRKVYLCRLALNPNQLIGSTSNDIYQYEYSTLLKGDIPIFYTKTNCSYIYNDLGIKIGDSSNNPNILDIIKNKLNNLSIQDFEIQTALINHSYMASNIKIDNFMNTLLKFDMTNFVLNSPDNKNNIAIEIGKLTINRSIRFDNQITWLGNKIFSDNYSTIEPIDLALYNGNSGICIFFYLLYNRTLNNMYLDYTKLILNQLVLSLEKDFNTEVYLDKIGAFDGIFSKIYAVVYIQKKSQYTLLENKEFKLLLTKVYNFINKELSSWRNLDLLSGLAGILGICITIHEVSSNSEKEKWKIIIKRISEIIISQAINIDNSGITWFLNDDIGYAHGNAGIIAQLARSYTLLNENIIKQVIEKALVFERQNFDKITSKWKFREGIHYYSWCNGIGGLLLCKLLLCNNGFDSIRLRKEMETLSTQLIELGFGVDYSICHGDVGSLEILFKYSQIIENKVLISQCNNMKNILVNNYLAPKLEELKYFENWGFMVGLAGLGASICTENNEVIDILLLM